MANKFRLTRRRPTKYVGDGNGLCHNNAVRFLNHHGSALNYIVQGICVNPESHTAFAHSWVVRYTGRPTDVALTYDRGYEYFGYILPPDVWVRRCEANGRMPYCLKRSEVTALMRLAGATDFIHSEERWLPEDYRD